MFLLVWRGTHSVCGGGGGLFVVQSRNGDWTDVGTLMASAARVNPSNARIWANMAFLSYENRDVEQAGPFVVA
jgi:hypothetical protein